LTFEDTSGTVTGHFHASSTPGTVIIRASAQDPDTSETIVADLTITVYPDAHHGFDAPGDRLAHRSDVTRGVDAARGVTAGPNPAARAAVEIALPEFLRRHFQGR
jgi:dienelactone hydrolase